MNNSVSAKRRLRRYEAGTPGDYLTHIDDLPPDRTHPVIYLRVSKDDNKSHLEGYETHLQEVVAAHGHTILDTRSEIAKGHVDEEIMHWRRGLIQAIEIAREHPNAYVLACSTCRFIRHPEMNKHQQDLIPTVEMFECLAGWANGVTLGTVWHPDTDWREVKRLQDQLFNPNNPGRPKKRKPGETKRRTKMNQSKVFWMRSVGFSISKVADLLGVDRSQVKRWWNQLK